MTSQPIRLSTNFMTLIFTDYELFPCSICNGCGMPAGNAYPSGHLVPSPILGLANAPIVETKFLELAMSLLDFSPRIPLGTFSILLANIGNKHSVKSYPALHVFVYLYPLFSKPRRPQPKTQVNFQDNHTKDYSPPYFNDKTIM